MRSWRVRVRVCVETLSLEEAMATLHLDSELFIFDFLICQWLITFSNEWMLHRVAIAFLNLTVKCAGILTIVALHSVHRYALVVGGDKNNVTNTYVEPLGGIVNPQSTMVQSGLSLRADVLPDVWTDVPWWLEAKIIRTAGRKWILSICSWLSFETLRYLWRVCVCVQTRFHWGRSLQLCCWTVSVCFEISFSAMLLCSICLLMGTELLKLSSDSCWSTVHSALEWFTIPNQLFPFVTG